MPLLKLRLAVLLLSLSGPAAAYDATDFNADGRKHQPPPSGHVPGKDQGSGSGLHNAGEDCATCHTPGGKASSLVFTMSGTLYEDRMGRRPLQGGEVILQDIEGNVISMRSNAIGNFWTTAPIASNPRAVASHGGTTEPLYGTDGGVFVPAEPTDSRTWQYKAWVVNGEDVRHMVTIAPVGGATVTTPRMSCNMHHAPLGGSGALWAGSKPTSTRFAPDEVSFGRDVRPVLINRCVPCHVPGKKLTRLVTESDLDASASTAIDYSSGHDFTSYGGSTVGATTKHGVSDVVEPLSPAVSPLLRKTQRQPPGTVIHAGGSFWTPTDAEYQMLLKWIAQGAKDN